MKSALSSTLGDLAIRFRDRSRKRVEEMSAQLERGDLEGLAHHFHGMTGLGATYGFPEISRLGDEGEGILIAAAKQKRVLRADELAKLGELIQGMRTALN